MNTKKLLKVPGVKPVIFSYAMFMLIGSAFTAGQSLACMLYLC